MKINPRPEVQWFANRMEEKLAENDHKAGWRDMPTSALLLHMYTEFAELKRALDNGEDSKEVVREAADIANFAMMIADNVSTQAMWNATQKEVEK